jgi:protein tyrosine kinase modulator
MEQEELKTGPSPHGWLRRISEQRRSILICIFAGWILVVGAAWVLPAKYRSETSILVEQQKVPEHYVEPNIAVDLQQRLQSMSEQILSRTRLMAIVEKFHLYSTEQKRSGMQDIVDQMRKDISIDLVRSAGAEISAFKVSYSAGNPITAQQVTGELTSLFIEENLQNRQQLSEDTTSFLETQLDGARKNLEQQELRLREFKSRYLGQLPEQTASNMQILAGLQNRLQSANDALNQGEQQKLYLQSMLNQYQSLRRAPAVEGSNLDGNNGIFSPSSQRLRELKSQLVDLKTKYTPQHPDVIRLETEIAEAEKQVAADQQAAKKGGSSTAVSNADPDDLRASAAMLQTQSQLKAVDFEIANRKSEIKSIEAEIETYQKKLNLAPAREQELAAITRDHEQSRAYYESLLAKKNQSEMATNLEKRQQGEQFRMIDPPSLPQKPYFPNRLLFSIGGLAFGIVLGLGNVVTRELLSGRIYGEDELSTIVKSPNVVLIPSVLTPGETRARSRSTLIDAAIATAIALAIPATTLILYYKA